MKDLKKIGKRLFIFMQKRNIGVNELGRMTNTSGAQISNIIKGKKYGVDKLLNILYKFPELNFYWLVEGKGEMEVDTKNAYQNIDIEATLKEVSDLKAKNKELVSEMQSLKSVNEKMTKSMEYQDLTIEAYKKTIDVQTASIKDLKEMLASSKENSIKLTKSKTA